MWGRRVLGMLPSFDAAIAIEMELQCQQSTTQLPTTTTARRLDEALPRLSTRQGHLLPPTHSQRSGFGNVANPLGRGRKVTIQIPILALPPALPPSTLNFCHRSTSPIHRPRTPPQRFLHRAPVTWDRPLQPIPSFTRPVALRAVSAPHLPRRSIWHARLSLVLPGCRWRRGATTRAAEDR